MRDDAGEDQLGSAIPLPKRVDRVQVSKERSERLDKVVTQHPAQMGLVPQPREQSVDLSWNVFGVTEYAGTLLYADGSRGPRPSIDILKQMPMDRVVMRSIQIASRHGLISALNRHGSFELLKLIGGSEANQVFENSRTGVAIDVVR